MFLPSRSSSEEVTYAVRWEGSSGPLRKALCQKRPFCFALTVLCTSMQLSFLVFFCGKAESCQISISSLIHHRKQGYVQGFLLFSVTWKVLIAALLFLILRIKIPLEGKDSCELLLYPIIWVKNYKETTSGRWMCCSAGLPIQSSLLMYPPYGNAAGCHQSLKYCRSHVQTWSTGQGRGLWEIHPTNLLIRKLYPLSMGLELHSRF